MGRTSDARERLLAAALQLIWTNSYGSVSVDDICARAEVKKGSFYHFFPSKADLALAAYEQHWEEMRPTLDAIFSPQVPPWERLSRWCRHIVEAQKSLFEQFGHVVGCPYCSMGSEIATQDDRLRAKSEELLNRGLRYLESAISDGQREGTIPSQDNRGSALAVASCVMGLMLQAKVQNDPKVLHELEPTVQSVLRVEESSLSSKLTARRRRPG
ncbi:MAG TPA: TetR/AcrR family transcriptional regulator [Verrucomicrobiota bacterium]|nr:TetR/AcrR family transcriptional regulator [Verrucomicrobiales bacterium]HRI13889.1 TetR/AcrR family transcriptional regulator [Verrucomicrobiota bacterium]